MDLIWDESLETGISIIDEQHQALFEAINKLRNTDDDAATYWEILIELQNYVSEHFSTEENIMESINYPSYKKHKASHDEFTATYKNFLMKLSKTESVLQTSKTLNDFLSNWLATHYKNQDIHLATYIKTYKKTY